jgi:DNA primase
MQRNNAVRAVKERLSLADIARRYVDLRRSGSRWTAPCPFHQETKPSFSIDEEKGTFHCFGCNASGDIFDFYGRLNGLDFKESLEQLAAEAGVELGAGGDGRGAKPDGRQRILRMYEFAAGHYRNNLSAGKTGPGRAYMEKRGIDENTAERFGLGYAPPAWRNLADALRRGGFDEALAARVGLLGKSEKNTYYDRFRGRLIFPIRNPSNRTIAFGGRIVEGDDEAKYINSADSEIYKKGDHLYALPQARRSIAERGRALLTEGYMDVLTLHRFGYEHAVGVLGTALTPEQAKRLSGFTSRVVLLFDGDAAGRKAAQRACEMLLPRGFECRVALLPQGEDIDSLLRSRGAESFEAVLREAPQGLRFCMDALRGRAPRDLVAWARNFLKSCAELPELYSRFASELAGGLGLTEESLRNAAPERRKNGAGDKAEPASIGGPDAVFEREILRFAVRYPRRCAALREAGADLFLKSSPARALWEKFFAHPSDELMHCLNEREKAFWVRCRAGEAPPLDNEEGELRPLLRKLAARHKKTAGSSVSAALREAAATGDFETNMEYIVALRETQRTSDEQS